MAAKPAVSTLFGRRLRILRRQRHLTQDELGQRADVTSKTIGEIERGLGNPSLDLIARLADALEIEASELLVYDAESETGGRGSPHMLAERVAGYISGRPREDVARALRILELALEGAPIIKGRIRGSTPRG